MDKSKILIFGAGGHGKVVLEILLSGRQKVCGFIDEQVSKKGVNIMGIEVFGGWEYLNENKNLEVALGIGDNKTRYTVYKKIKSMGHKVINAIHPAALISKDVRIGEGVVIMPGVVINPGTVIEDGVVINTSATVDHDCCLKEFCQIWPGAHLAGLVRVGHFSYIGTGAAVIQNVAIGRDVTIGAGAAVIRDISDGTVAVGVPARILRKEK